MSTKSDQSAAALDTDREQLRDELRTRLDAERERLHQRLDELDALHHSSEIQAHAGENDDDLGVEKRVGDSLEAGFHEALAAVEAALSVIDTDGFGLCRQCAAPIPAERLLILPSAQCCVACADRAGS